MGSVLELDVIYHRSQETGAFLNLDEVIYYSFDVNYQETKTFDIV